jgi:hypothetical protein
MQKTLPGKTARWRLRDFMFVILWEFQVKSGFEEEFARMYGSDGDWARLFRASGEYRGTRLSRDCGRDGWFYTLDLWESQKSYDLFRQRHAEAYAEIDRRCDAMTLQENFIASFDKE